MRAAGPAPSLGRAAGLYAKHLAIAWPGLLAATSVAGFALDRTRVNFLFDFPNSAPFFAGYIVAGLAAGYWLNRRDRARAALWVWLPPMAIFMLDAISDFRYSGWHGVWIAEFSRSCQASECLGEFIGTAPLLACLAYSLGAWLARRGGDAEARTFTRKVRT